MTQRSTPIPSEVSTPEIPSSTGASLTSAQQAWRAAVDAVATTAKAKLPPECGSRLAKAVELVLAGAVELLDGGQAIVKSQSQSGATSYTLTNGSCECPDFAAAPAGWCKHRLARALVIRAREVAKELGQNLPRHSSGTESPVTLRPEEFASTEGMDFAGALEDEPAPLIPPQLLVTIQGKQFVTYNGLLHLAHQQGLVALRATFISVTADLALAAARAMFHDGRTFTEAADATPGNVNSRIKPHFARMALTRAKARALRDALNISMVAVEELE